MTVRPDGEHEVSVDALRALFETAPVGIAFYDPAFKYIDVNPAFAEMAGRSRADHRGRTPFEILPPLADQIVAHLTTVLATGRSILDIDLSGPRPPGCRNNARWSASFHPVSGGGQGVAAVAIVADVTVERRAEAVLLAQKEMLERCAAGESLQDVLRRITKTIVERVCDGAIGSILLVDEGHLRHGAAPELPPDYTAAIDGTRVGPVAGSCGTAAYRKSAVFVSDIETDPLWHDYRHLALPHGLRACWSIPIVATDGTVLGTFALYYREPKVPAADDVTAIELLSRTTAIIIEWSRTEERQRRALDAEQKARQAAEAASRSKDEFVATLSHELRTPLNAIVGWSSILRMPDIDAALFERAVAAIERNAAAQTTLVEDLLDIARIASGKLHLQRSPIQLNTVVEGALDAVRPVAEAKGVELVATLAPEGPPLDGDAPRLRQVVWNLLSNAIKFTPSGGRVEMRVDRQPTEAHVVVSDTGQGISADDLPHIFERYRQGGNASGGLGLGLAIAHHVVEMHGGSMRAHSDGAGRGSRFDVTLPAAPATHSPARG